MNGDIQGALEAYLHADLINPDSKWVIRRIAGCYRTLKQPEEALKYYHRYEAFNPDDLSIHHQRHFRLLDSRYKKIGDILIELLLELREITGLFLHGFL